MNNEAQTERLLALVEETQRQECRKLLDEAREKHRQLVRAARNDARARVHEAVERERARAISRVRAVEAEFHTKLRAKEQQVAESLLAKGWTLLEENLRNRWRDPMGRRAWIERCAREAVRWLPTGHWKVEHPVGCGPADLSLFTRIVTEHSPDNAVEMVEAELEAGLVISADKTFLDMSLRGFMRDRESVEGRMLALLDEAPDR
jgi:hypothetical protein